MAVRRQQELCASGRGPGRAPHQSGPPRIASARGRGGGRLQARALRGQEPLGGATAPPRQQPGYLAQRR
eukprot:1300042-Alexandrium_andersonii.AAC.1